MKKFVWSMQRLLEIKEKQEQIVRGELVALTEQTVAIRGRIMALKTELRRQLAELNDLAPDQRMQTQALYLQYVSVRDEEIRRLQDQWSKLETQRREKLDELLKAQKFRKGLEQLRSRARAEYEQELNREEQKFLDECTHAGLTRKQMQTCSE